MAVATPRSGDLLAPGQRIGPFLLLAPLGSGGSGRAWAVARTGQLGFTKRMVLKVLRQDKLQSERARRRFDLEALLGAQLRHGHVRAVHEVGSHEGRPYMALSWVDASLAELLEHVPGRRLEPSIACWLAIQTCEALAAAHGHVNHAQQPCPIVHGDVSPGNILLTLHGHVLLADLVGAAEPSATRPSGSPAEEAAPARFFGSLGYASPEALKGLAIDGRSDLFSLGCVLYEMLCGSAAFEGDDERAIIYQVLEQGPPDVRQRAPHVAPELAALLRKALERRAEERFQTADELRSALRECVEGQGSFRLEERSSDLIQRVLGARIRAREEEMRLVFQRFSASAFERTDTLPIAGGGSERTTATLRTRAPESASERAAALSRSSGMAAPVQPRPARWGFWAVLLLALLLAGGYLVKEGGRAALLEAPALPAQASRADRGGTGAEQTPQQALGRWPAESDSAAHESSAHESASGAARLSTALPALTPTPNGKAAGGVGPAREQPAAERRVPVRARSSTAARAARSGPRQPFQWNFPADPYEEEGQGLAPRPSPHASRPSAESPAAPELPGTRRERQKLPMTPSESPRGESEPARGAGPAAAGAGSDHQVR